MANRFLFNTRSFAPDAILPAPDTVNEAGGMAHRLSAKAALAEYASTGCLNGTFYATAEGQLTNVLALANQCDTRFVAKLALHCRSRGLMKDMPALLCATLAVRDGDLLDAIFDRVVDNARMLRTFVQIVRSGVAGRRSLGSRPRRLVRRWLEARSDAALLAASVGSDPSLADVVRMVHPRLDPDRPR
ncbi:MAG: hypothetical protein U0575_05345 [Phycisphaerales bacterium]